MNGQWFKHDSNAHQDPRVKRLKKTRGREGVDIYFELIEMMRQDETTYAIDVADLDVLLDDVPNLAELVGEMVDIGLLVEREGLVYSERLLRDMELKDRRSEVRSEAGRRGAAARWHPHDKRIEDDGKAIADDAREEEKEQKKSYANNVRLKESEYQKLVTEFGESQATQMIRKLDAYKGSNGKRYKSDYMAIRLWVIEAVKAKPVDRPNLCRKCGAEMSGWSCLKCGWEAAH